MSWFPHRRAFLALYEGSLGIWTVSADTAAASVAHASTVAAADKYCEALMSVHVFGVHDDDEAEEDETSALTRYYIVGLLKDGRNMVLFDVTINDEAYVFLLSATKPMSCDFG